MNVVRPDIIKKVIPKRDPWAHKGDYGKLLVIAGGFSFGSEVLVSLAAQRVGCDYIKVFGPKGSKNIGYIYPEIIFLEYSKDILDLNAMEQLNPLLSWAKAIVIGNSLGLGKDQENLVNEIASKYQGKIVLDADAIKMINKNLIGPNMLLTPNSYEFKLLSGEEPLKDLEGRAKQVLSVASKLNTTILLKGHYDVISDGRDVFVNKVNSVYMAKPGTGDVLAGIAGGLLSQRNTILDAALASAYINGSAGRLAAKEKKSSLSPMDIIEKIPFVISRDI